MDFIAQILRYTVFQKQYNWEVMTSQGRIGSVQRLKSTIGPAGSAVSPSRRLGMLISSAGIEAKSGRHLP
jgi:hypothetical protein